MVQTIVLYTHHSTTSSKYGTVLGLGSCKDSAKPCRLSDRLSNNVTIVCLEGMGDDATCFITCSTVYGWLLCISAPFFAFVL